MVDEGEDTSRHFSITDLRQLFKLNLKSECETHETYKCKRCVLGRQVIAPFAEEEEVIPIEKIETEEVAEVKVIGLDLDAPSQELRDLQLNDDEEDQENIPPPTLKEREARKKNKDQNAKIKKKDMSNWNHWSEKEMDRMTDVVLKRCGKGQVSFVFENQSHEV